MPVRERSPEVKAHRQVVQTDVDDIVKFLEEVLTRKLVAYMVGTSDVKAVGRWASGDRRPRRETEERLRNIFHVFQLLQQEESPHTVRAWFIGLNPQLDDKSPAASIRDGEIRDVLVAARSWIAGG